MGRDVAVLKRDDLLRALDRLAPRNPRHELELYRRRSDRTRARFEPGRSIAFAHIDEVGVAVRAVDGRLREGFAATTGFDSRGLDAATESAIAAIREPPARGLPRGAGAPRVDGCLDTAGADAAALASWLDRLRGRLEAAAETRGGVRVALAEIEAGRVDEEIVSTCGIDAHRIRERAWATVHAVSAECGQSWALAAAGRGALPEPESLVDAVALLPHAGHVLTPRAGEPVVLAPLAAGVLVRAMAARVAAGREVPKARAAGAGWRLLDRPGAAGALVGGEFDDTGVPTGESVLADGHTCATGLPADGRRWRGSFRDPPQVRAANVEVDLSEERSVDPGGLRVEDVRLHALPGSGWILEALAVRPSSGERGRTWLRVRPEDLAERCVAAFGPPRSTAQGVRTPFLVFDPRGWY